MSIPIGTWVIYHKAYTAGGQLILDDTVAVITGKSSGSKPDKYNISILGSTYLTDTYVTEGTNPGQFSVIGDD